jgi:hypothetical protein
MIAPPPPTATAADQSAVTITAPKTVKPGARFNVRTRIDVGGSDPVFLTGGFMDFDGTRLSPTRRRCPATPAGTFAADTPQPAPIPPGPGESRLRERNDVRRTGTLRYCVWLINSRTYETDAAGFAYIKAYAKKKRRRHARIVAKQLTFTGRTRQRRLPIRLSTANRRIRGLAYTAVFRCTDGFRVDWATRLPTFAYGRFGRFNASLAPLNTINDSVQISGRVKGRSATGSFSETYTSVLGNTCKSGTVKFTATAPKKKR